MSSAKIKGLSPSCLGEVKSVAADFGSLIAFAGVQAAVIQLRPQQRLAHSANSRGHLLAVREGVLAIDVTPSKAERQILDFLMPGDMVLEDAYLSSYRVSVRAITGASLISVTDLDAIRSDVKPEIWKCLFDQAEAQLARSNIHQLIIGHLESEARVASFLMTVALRGSGSGSLQSGMQLALPMSRDDIADYVAVNHDTLSRVMSRFETLGVINRINRHSLQIADIEKLTQMTPIAGLLSFAFDQNFGPHARANGHRSRHG
jgi:CRP/FNR family transcriptional regulator, anaerobic regulatory protein